MKIHGLQKMTLLDYPGHVACTVFLGGCDLRCPFCHNYDLAAGIAQPVMEEEDLFAFLQKRKGLLDGVAFTGGEPCLRKELPDVLARVKDLGFKVKLDTNGCHPDVLGRILESGLTDYVAMDIKNSPEKYAQTSGLEQMDLAPVYESISMLMNGSCEYEFRTTVVRELHEENDFYEIGKMIAGAPRYFLQSFTDRDEVHFEGFHAPDADDLKLYKKIVSQYVADVQIRGSDAADS